MAVGPVSGTVADIASVNVEKKSQQVEKQIGQAMVSLIDRSGPQLRTPPPGSTVSVVA